jgi:hypothetical protein
MLLTGAATQVDRKTLHVSGAERFMTLLSLVKLIHLLGLIMGFGGAILADMLILKGAILNPIEHKTIVMVRSLSHIVFVGLGVLWISGILLVSIRVSADPNVWMNQKIWAKVIIVSILTINGILVHNIALGRLEKRLAQKLFSTSRPYELAGLSLIAAVSSVSWIVPFVLGVATEFNFTVRALGILIVYAMMVVIGWAAFFTIAYLSANRSRTNDARFRQAGTKPERVRNASRIQAAAGLVPSQLLSDLQLFKQEMRDHEVRWAEFQNEINQSVANFDQSLGTLDDLQSVYRHRKNRPDTIGTMVLSGI